MQAAVPLSVANTVPDDPEPCAEAHPHEPNLPAAPPMNTNASDALIAVSEAPFAFQNKGQENQ